MDGDLRSDRRSDGRLPPGLPVVLVVEDEASIIELLGALMAPLDVQLLPARDGHQALEALSGKRPALITLDLVLPGMDGLTLLSRIRERPDLADVPVLAISAQSDSASQKRAYASGVSDFVIKPFSVELLEAKLRMWLRLSLLAGKALKLRDFAHEARNPLTAITAAAQVICREDTDLPMRRRLGKAIEEEADRLGRLVHTCVSGEASLDPGSQAVTLAPYRLLLDVVEMNLPGPAARERVKVRCTGPLPALRVDPDRLRQMLVNLLDNAVAATCAGGEIAIEAFVADTGVALSVRDTGVGIEKEDLPRIFEDGFTRRGGRARGLGLGITRRLCLAAGGQLQVASERGVGTIFTLWLPR